VPREVTLLPELLPDGYQTAAFVSNMVLTDEALGIADRFDHYDDFVAERESSRRVYERNATHTTDATLAWLGEGRDSERPLFLWVHYIDPHGPYRPPAHAPRSFDHEGDRPIPRKRVHPYQVRPGVDDALVYIDRYDEEIAYVDAEIGRLLDGYAARWPSEEALVLFTADHGESMMEHERWFTHGYQVYEEIVAVPLLVRGPGIAAGRVEHPTPGTAVASTILRFTGSPVPDALPPIDLRTGSGLSADGLVLVEATLEKHQWRAAIRGRRKWSMAIEGRSRQITAQRFYDLDLDPDEERQRSWALSEAPPEALVRAWRDDPDPAGIPETMREGMKLSAPKVNPNVGDDVRERLRGLGYVDPEGG
jgi:arylsulfatase A-like enzyme